MLEGGQHSGDDRGSTMQPPFEQDDSGMTRPAKGTLCGLKAAAVCLARDPNLCDLDVLLLNLALFALIFRFLHALSFSQNIKIVVSYFLSSVRCAGNSYI
jgi:hypothetical protein